jgi:hypothetical protein
MSWWQTRQAIERAEIKHKTVIAHERLDCCGARG